MGRMDSMDSMGCKSRKRPRTTKAAPAAIYLTVGAASSALKHTTIGYHILPFNPFPQPIPLVRSHARSAVGSAQA